MATINKNLSVTDELKEQLITSLHNIDPTEIGSLPQSSFMWVRLSTQEQAIFAQQRGKKIFVREFMVNKILRRSYYILVPSEDAIRCAI